MCVYAYVSVDRCSDSVLFCKIVNTIFLMRLSVCKYSAVNRSYFSLMGTALEEQACIYFLL